MKSVESDVKAKHSLTRSKGLIDVIFHNGVIAGMVVINNQNKCLFLVFFFNTGYEIICLLRDIRCIMKTNLLKCYNVYPSDKKAWIRPLLMFVMLDVESFMNEFPL